MMTDQANVAAHRRYAAEMNRGMIWLLSSSDMERLSPDGQKYVRRMEGRIRELEAENARLKRTSGEA